MWWVYLGIGGVLGWLMTLVIACLVILLIVCLCCGVSLDSLLSWGEGKATLTCFHCGQKTQAGGKMCEHCQRELQ